MKAIFLSLALFVSATFAKPNYYGSHNNYYQASSSSASALSPWAQDHMDEVKKMADRMRNEFNTHSYGASHSGLSSSSSSHSTSSTSSFNFPRFTGKSQEELDLIAKQMTEQMIIDMKSGRLSYSQISQPNWFEQQAAMRLEALDHIDDSDDDMLQQQSQSVFDNFEPQVRDDSYGTEIESLNNFDEISHVTYPPRVSVHGGRRYVTRKNCTSVTTTNGGTMPVYSGSYFDSKSNAHEETVNNYPGQIVIPVEDSQYKRESLSRDVQQTYYPEFNFSDGINRNGFGSFGIGNQIYNVNSPGHQAKITINQTNRTYTGTPGREIVTGCRGTTVIVNGNVVYNYSQAIGTGSPSCTPSFYEEAEWKRRERENLFWLLAQGNIKSEDELQLWQQQNWQKLTQLAQEYKATVEEIKEFQRSELKYYFDMLNTYPSISSEYYDDWKKKEGTRWDWLIQQNKISQEELARWQLQNQERLVDLARLYSISLEELQNWQKNELLRVQNLLMEQNSEINKLREWQLDVQNRLNSLMYQHNITIEQLREKIREDLIHLETLSRQYHINTEEFRKWLEAEQKKISDIIENQKPSKIIENWQQEERYRLEHIIRQFNLSMDEIKERLERDHNYLMSLANQYHISIDKLKEWQRQEIIRLQNEGRLQTARLEAWQKQLQDQLKTMIREHEITVAELEEIIRRDHKRLEDLAQQYRVSVQQIENWYRNEARRLFEVWKAEDLTIDWRWRERQRIDDFIKHYNFTVEELRERLISDRKALEDIANSYNLRIQELENWYETEIKRLQELGLVRMRIEMMENWQREEENYIRNLIQTRNFTIEDLEQRLKNDYEHLRQTSQQYRISQEQIMEWYRKEIEHLFKTGLIRHAERLKDWQIQENEYINELIKNHTFTIEDLVHRLEFDRHHLEELQKQYNVQINEIIEFYRTQAESLVNRGIIKEMEKLEEWQRAQRQYIYQLMRNHEISIKELESQLLQNQQLLNQLSLEYHVSINQLKEWYHKEIKRLVNQGFFNYAESLKTWQQFESERIRNLIKEQNMNYEELKKMLLDNHEHLYSLATQYHTTILEIENWYRSELLRLREEGLIHDITQWQLYIRNYLEQLTKDHRWSIEELQEKFRKNEDNLYNLIQQYHITMDQLIEWYNKELERLYEQDMIYRKSLLDWQTQERIRLENFIREHHRSLQAIYNMLLRNEELLKQIASQYNITIQQLRDWYDRLINEFLLKDMIINDLKSEEKDWEEKERQRLNFLLIHSKISYDEFVDFLRDDERYNNMLAQAYRTDINILTQFQLRLLQEWVEKGYLQKLKLIHLEQWQKLERDSLYDLIRQHAITKDKLPEWQNLKSKDLEQSANRYGISFQTLIDWQRNELQRLYELGLYYNMTFTELEQFRSAELLRISNTAHHPTLDSYEYENWEVKEHLRLEDLRRRYQLTDEQLWKWRRELFLYCQGLLHLKRRCVPDSTYLGAINMNRGDQPPHMGPNECEDDEPGLLDPLRIPPTPRPSRPNLPYQTPLAQLPIGNTKLYEFKRNRTEHVIYGPRPSRTGFENTMEYKQESGGPISSSGSTGWQHSPSKFRSHNTGRLNERGYSHSGVPTSSAVASNNDDKVDYLSDQQQYEDLTQQFEDFGQQQQNVKEDLEDLGQQQNPVYNGNDNLSQQRTRERSFNRSRNYNLDADDSGQQIVQQPNFPTAKEIEDLRQQRERSHHRAVPKNSDEHPAKVEEINPNLEVEAVQVTEKPGLWKRVFG